MPALFERLPARGWLHRNRAKLAGLLAGLVLPLLAAGLVAAGFSGGLSDVPVRSPSVYQLY